MILDHTSPVVHVGNLSQVPIRTKHASISRRSLSDQKQTDPVVTLGHLILPPSRQPWSRGEGFQPTGYIATSAYWAHKHQYVIVSSILAHEYQLLDP
jgi:hypothetical protein